jgi:hypothetical protein
MANIASDVLGFFMVSFQIRAGSLSPFLKNMTIHLSSTSVMIEALNELPKGLSLLLDNTSQIPVNSQMCTCGAEVAGE